MKLRILFLTQEPHQEPLGAGYLISAARKAGHVADGRFFNSPAQAVRIAAQAQPDVLAFSVMTGMHGMYAKLSALIKTKINVFSVFGGPHPTYSPDYIEADGVDAICRGEGEAAIAELLDAMGRGEDYTKTSNFIFKTRGGVVSNPLRPLAAEIDTLEFPDREFFYASANLRVSHLKSFIAARGCPYSCTYCFNHIHNEIYKGLGPVVRRRSVDNVIEEVLAVKMDYPLGMAQFMDDTFILSGEWLREFSDKFPRLVGIPFFCNARAELVTHDVVRDLKRAGCASVCVGIESGDDELRKRVLGRTQGNDTIRRSIELLRANGIRVMTTNMLGIPGGSLESDLMTLRLNSECRVDYAWASLTYPYPGTRIHAIAKELGLDVPGKDSLTHSYFNKTPFLTTEKNEVENLHRLLALAVSLKLSEPRARALAGTKSKAAKLIYTLLFGFWKLYCYETKIFRRADGRVITAPDFFPRLFNNAAVGFKMMFGWGRTG